MNEKDIRDRIGQFLKRTARTVVVPASMGLGLSTTACNGNGLRQAGEAGIEAGTTRADAPATTPDLAVDTVRYDMPMMMVPYVIAMALDAAPDTAPDAESDVLPDARTDISYPPPPYLAPMPPDAAKDGTRETSRADANKDALPDVRAEVRFPEPPYLLPAMIDDPLLGTTVPPAKK
jgi:hypothetical protein